MHHLIPSLLLIPLLAAVVGFLIENRRLARPLLAIGAALVLLIASSFALAWVYRHGPAAVAFGGWPAPFGVVFVLDFLSAALVLMTALIGFLGSIYVVGSVGEEQQGALLPTLHLMLVGVIGSFLTADLFNLFVWFELMLVSSFVLLILGGERAQLEGAMKYVVLSVIASALLLFAVALVYRTTGTLSFAELAGALPEVQSRSVVQMTAMLLIASFAIKAGVFPLFFWLPASYHTPPVAVTALFSALLTKVGVYVLFRVLTLLYASEVELLQAVLLPAAALTMVTGVLGAVAEQDVRRLLAFHIISQIGYMIFGLAVFTSDSLAAGLFFIFHIMVAKTALFWVAGLMQRAQGSFHLSRLGGLARPAPGMALLFFVPAMSLAGIPPLSGFVGKLALVRAGLLEQRYLVVAVAIAVSLLTLLSMTKIWKEAFWGPRPDDAASGDGALDEGDGAPGVANDRRLDDETGATPFGLRGLSLYLPAGAFALLTLVLGAWAEPFYSWCEASARQLQNPALYIETVLGASR